ncbi:MAG: DnaJ domain-containing protein [Candidatus Lernaella stagnicola]|nr:DnaJ domain-containing protein [Candidatus Lernaella stagnicola]
MKSYRVSYYGDIAQFHVREQLLSLAAQRESGVLFLRRERVLAKIYFEKGKIVFAQTNRARDSFVRYLFEEGQLDLATLEGWREKIADETESQSFADYYVEKAGLSKEQFQRTIQDWLQTLLRDIIRWYRGSYVYLFDDPLPPNAETLRVSLAPFTLVVDSATVEMRKSFLRRHFRDNLDDPILLADSTDKIVERLRLQDADAEFVHGLEGGVTVKNAILGRQSSTSRSFNLLFVMETLGMMSFPERLERRNRNGTGRSEMSVEGMALLQRLKETGAALLRLPPFELLDIGRFFSEEDLRKGYYTIAQNYHPKELVDSLPPELRELSYRIFEHASEIFEAFVVWEKKRLIDKFAAFRQLEKDYFGSSEAHDIGAEIEYLFGLTEYRQGALQAASDRIQNAARRSPFQTQYRALLAYVEFQMTQDDAERKRLLGELRKCSDEDPTGIDVRVFHGEALERLGRIEEAHEQFRIAAEIAPNDPELAAAVRRTYPSISATELEQHDDDRPINLAEAGKLKHKLEEMEKGTYFEILGIQPDTPLRETRNRYFELAKIYHPDHFKNSPYQDAVEDIFVLINEAYDVLSSEEKRANYIKSLQALEDQKIQLEHEKRRNEQRMLQKGRSFIDAGKWTEACEFLSQAIGSGNYQNLLFKVFYAWALFNRDQKTDSRAQQRAEKILDEVERQDPTLAEIYAVHGKIYRRLDQFRKAKQFFDKTLRLDPDHIDALREMRLMNQRIAAEGTEPKSDRDESDPDADGKKGFFGSIFGRRKS